MKSGNYETMRHAPALFQSRVSLGARTAKRTRGVRRQVKYGVEVEVDVRWNASPQVTER
jgi:hypothetical protein